MIEVFKTNVLQQSDAQWLIARIILSFKGYSANFDLEDRDHILRVTTSSGIVDSSGIILLLKKAGYTASILPDDIGTAGEKSENWNSQAFLSLPKDLKTITIHYNSPLSLSIHFKKLLQ